MSDQWRSALERWLAAGLLDEAAAARIRAWETTHATRTGQSRLAAIVFALGGLLLAAGILLFVAAHWDDLAPGGRFALAMSMVAALHVGGAYTARTSPALSTVLHAVGTASLGAAIFLAGQIFNMAEHWPGALLLWALGAMAGLYLLRDWPHVVWVALLAPAWLAGEWIEANASRHWFAEDAVVAVGAWLFAVAYLAADRADSSSVWRRALMRLGAVALIPSASLLSLAGDYGSTSSSATGVLGTTAAWAVALGLPTVLVGWLRGRQATWFGLAIAWALLVVWLDWSAKSQELALYGLLALGSSGVVMWGLRDQQRLHVNLGILGFALTIAGFYFSSVFDKLGRSLGLICMGVLFIGGGWLLERTRRSLVARIGDRP